MIKNQQYLNQNQFRKSSIISQNRASQTFRKLIEDQNPKQLGNSYSLNWQSFKSFNTQSNIKISQNFSQLRFKKSKSKIENLIINEQDQIQPLFQSYKFLHAKSHHLLPYEVVQRVSIEKQWRKEEQNQSKSPDFQKQTLTKVKSMGSNLVFSRCIDKIARLNQKTQQSKQLCLEIKRKIFKETTIHFRQSKGLCLKDFKLGQILGKDKFGKKIIARHIITGIIVAIKIINKQMIKKANLKEQLLIQIKIQKNCEHPSFVKLYGFFDDSINIYILLQHCWGDQLYDIFNTRKRLKQQDWAPILKGICQGILQLHRQKIINRDIKPENILMSFGMPKICYFGQSIRNFNLKHQFYCGTPFYIFPELLIDHNYEKQVDVWALGIMMYEFLTGKAPFNLQNEENVAQMINCKISFPNNMSPNCLNLLNSMLNKNIDQRITIKNILSHPFLTIKSNLDNNNVKMNKQK